MPSFCAAPLSRREFLALPLLLSTGVYAQSSEKKSIATVITAYYPASHADVIIGRMLYGYDYYGEHHDPDVKVVSMYTDQVPSNDMSRALAVEHGFAIKKTVEEALTMGGNTLAVEGVVLIGEHGNYPYNEKGQQLYPRYRLFKNIVDTFIKTGRTVPVCTDKHLSTDWNEAKWMYDRSVEMDFPLMAGSSLPLWWRMPEVELETGTPVSHAVVTSYGGKESYGFHGLECLQCMVERRESGETGIIAVQCLEGIAVWNWTDANPWAGRLLDSALAQCPEKKTGSPRITVKKPILFILEYASGLLGAVYNLDGHVSSWAFAADIPGGEVLSFQFRSNQGDRPYAHFSPLVYHIERMMVTRKPSYPVERTLLTTGALSLFMESSYRGNIRIETPYLNMTYPPPTESFFWRWEKPTGVFNEPLSGFHIGQNTPNPFNAVTTITFSLDAAGEITLIIYNLPGQKVRELLTGHCSVGPHSILWDGRDDTGNTVSSGVYLSRLTCGGKATTGRMVLMK